MASFLPWDLPQAKTWGSLGNQMVIHALTTLRAKQWTSWGCYQRVGKLDQKNAEFYLNKCWTNASRCFHQPCRETRDPQPLPFLILEEDYKSPQMLLEAFQLCSERFTVQQGICKLKDWKTLTSSSRKFSFTHFQKTCPRHSHLNTKIKGGPRITVTGKKKSTAEILAKWTFDV